MFFTTFGVGLELTRFSVCRHTAVSMAYYLRNPGMGIFGETGKVQFWQRH
jgi:hypothetical protein